MIKLLDELNKNELQKLVDFIPWKRNFRKEVKILFPEVKGKGTVKALKNIRNYAHFKLRALSLKGRTKEVYEEKINLISIAVNWFMDIPEWARLIDLSLIKKS